MPDLALAMLDAPGAGWIARVGACDQLPAVVPPPFTVMVCCAMPVDRQTANAGPMGTVCCIACRHHQAGLLAAGADVLRAKTKAATQAFQR